MAGRTSVSPLKSVELIPGTSPKRPVTIGAESMYAACLVTPSTGTYGNGVDLTGANHGDSNTAEATVEQLEIPAIHPHSTTAYDKTTAFTTGDPAIAIEHVVNQGYWLKGSSLSITRDDKIICTSSGLVKKALAHTATPLPVHTWKCIKTVSAQTYVQGRYMGLVSSFTA